MKFIFQNAEDAKQNSENVLHTVKIKYMPGEEVIFIQNNSIIKRKISKIKVETTITEKGAESSVRYKLGKGTKEFAEDEIFKNLSEITIEDQTK